MATGCGSMQGLESKDISITLNGKQGNPPKKKICLLCQRSGGVHWLLMPGELDATPSLPLSAPLSVTISGLFSSFFFDLSISGFMCGTGSAVAPSPWTWWD